MAPGYWQSPSTTKDVRVVQHAATSASSTPVPGL
eukprot:CAMPEP_0202875336 /NCGR_PEP_ID=MMETSP1391-20130828/27112_1 /ASSEMBLY_ACC=CAM_ASM_000867 /TAXON_ID=1034604 /ORGANISM="Chlamydomonas leiostraca, Strain SAG 11-49" /LENGTH=33 /DNA_ID= /DNA_START= /DNA_END= /DNA_ORIENTATION=